MRVPQLSKIAAQTMVFSTVGNATVIDSQRVMTTRPTQRRTNQNMTNVYTNIYTLGPDVRNV